MLSRRSIENLLSPSQILVLERAIHQTAFSTGKKIAHSWDRMGYQNIVKPC